MSRLHPIQGLTLSKSHCDRRGHHQLDPEQPNARIAKNQT